MQRVVEDFIKTSSVCTFTEVDSEAREKVLRQVKGWGFVAGDKTGRDDCAIIWDSSVWTLLHKETKNVAKYMAGNIGAAFAVLEHKATGRAVVFSVVHLPSAVEGNGRVAGGRADEWRLARKNWLRHVKALQKRFSADAIIVADWNLDWKKRWVRVLIRSLMPKWKMVWGKKLPVVGTHGNRLIDWTMFRGRIRVVRRPSIHKITKASDHRGYDETLAFVQK